MRFVEHTLRLDPDAEQNVAHAWCMSCGVRSIESVDKGAVQKWCLEHTGQSGHGRFRAVVETFFVVGRTEEVKSKNQG